jgi:hypothetical protein
MSDLLATLTILVLFFIRFGIPFLTLALISYVLHRLKRPLARSDPASTNTVTRVERFALHQRCKMNEFLASLTILSFFALRLAVPFLVVLLVGYLMSRLDAYWQAHP